MVHEKLNSIKSHFDFNLIAVILKVNISVNQKCSRIGSRFFPIYWGIDLNYLVRILEYNDSYFHLQLSFNVETGAKESKIKLYVDIYVT